MAARRRSAVQSRFLHHAVVGRIPLANGRTLVVIICPCCGAEVRAHIWSMAGSGKRCACGAKHLLGSTMPPVGWTPKAGQEPAD